MWQCQCGTENADSVINCRKCHYNRDYVAQRREAALYGEAASYPREDSERAPFRPEQKTPLSFVREVWYGQRSLAQIFWWWGFLIGNIVLGYGGLFLATLLSRTVGSQFPLYFHFALTFPYGIWTTVGSWRSATNNPGFWAVIVKILVIVGIPMTIFSWIQLFNAESLSDLLR